MKKNVWESYKNIRNPHYISLLYFAQNTKLTEQILNNKLYSEL